MSKRLEDFIRANKDQFNDLEPRMELWDNIAQQLNDEGEPKKREARTFSLGFVLRVAATIIVVMGVCFVFYLRSGKTSGSVSLADINPDYAKEQVHYASLVQTKRTELKQVAKTDPQLYREFSSELAKMDSVYRVLSRDLATSPNQERTLRAMIRNLQAQAEVLNQQINVIQQFNQIKKEQQNEIKNI